MFGGTLAAAGLVIATVVFPFWNLIREDVYEEVVVLSADGQVCVAETSDRIPKHVQDCTAREGDTITIKYGRGLAWAVMVEP